MQDLLTKYGLYGIVMAGLSTGIVIMWKYIIKREKDHADEREKADKAHMDVIEKIADRWDRKEDESQKLMRDHNSMLSEIKTMLQHNNRK